MLAVELAEAGIEAPQRALDGKYGFFKLYGREARPELLVEKPELCNGLIIDFLATAPVPTLAPIRRARTLS